MSIYSDLSRVYSASFIRSILSSNHYKFLKELSNSFSFVNESLKNDDYKLLFEEGYNTLLSNYRCEYIYKSEIYDKIRKQNKRRKKNGILTEVRSGKSIADLLWLNGTSIAYEIKTEIDTNRRLEKQIESYQYLFKETTVVTYEKNIPLIKSSLPPVTGIMYLNGKGMLKVYRGSTEYIDFLNPEIMFLTLRRNEYENAIKEAFGYIPEVSDAHIYNECYNLFKTLNPLEAHNLMVKQLKNRSSINIKDEENKWPKSVMFLLEKGGLKKSEIDKFESYLI